MSKLQRLKVEFASNLGLKNLLSQSFLEQFTEKHMGSGFSELNLSAIPNQSSTCNHSSCSGKVPKRIEKKKRTKV